MQAYRAGRLQVRRNLHLGVGFLAATNSSDDPDRLKFRTLDTACGRVSTFEAGSGEPIVMIHGLGATKAEFLPTVPALAPEFRTIAIDLPGFGDSDKPFPARYDARFFARWVDALLDALGARPRAPARPQHGRPGGARGGHAPPRPDQPARPDDALDGVALGPVVGVRAEARPARARLPPAGAEGLRGGDRQAGRAGLRLALRGSRARRVPALLPHPARPRRLLRRRPQHLRSRTRTSSGRGSRRCRPRRSSSGAGATGSCRSASPATSSERLPAARHCELDCGHVPQLERPAQLHSAITRFLRSSAHAPAGRRSRSAAA